MAFEGIYTALITPFQESGRGIDESVFRNLIEKQISAGVHGIIVAGSTGEGQTMSDSEWRDALKIALSYKKSIQVLGSCGSSSTEWTTERYKELSDMGASGALISSPPYNKPPQRGLIQHYEMISKAAKLPIMAYNIPGRTAVSIQAATMKEIWKIENVVSLKESSGNLEVSLPYILEAPQGKSVLSGDDPLNLAFFLHGARGSVSVLSNILPEALVKLWKLSQAQDYPKASELQKHLLKFIPLLFAESNPIPIKWIVGRSLNRSLKPRLPLVELESQWQSKLISGLEQIRSLGLF